MVLENIDTLVFDIGNVLLLFTPLEYLRGKYDEELVEIIYREVFASREWVDLDRGTISEEEAIESISSRRPGMRKYISEVLKGFDEMLQPIEKSILSVKTLEAKGYKLLLLSNFHKKAFDIVYNKYDFFNLFHGGIISSHYHLMKPEKEIFEALIDEYRLRPEASLFIDDTLDNIRTASEMGFKTIHFKENMDLIDVLNIG